LGELAVQEKSNEITAPLSYLICFCPKNCIVTIDNEHTKKLKRLSKKRETIFFK